MAEMRYRTVPRTGDEVGIIGMGTSSNGASGVEETVRTVRMALDAGVNYFDLAAGDSVAFEAFGEALKRRRGEAILQMHFGADYSTGAYGRVYGLDNVKRSVAWQMDRIGTDYIDYGFIHCIDSIGDLEEEWDGGIVDHILKLKEEGTVRHVGLSTHTPAVAMRALDSGIVDMVMFSINPAYDYQKEDFAYGEVDERSALYRRYQSEGVGISVMKAFGGGQLTDAKLSPFGRALSVPQCIQYALDKPGVVTVLPGVRNRDDLRSVLTYLDAPVGERDYSEIGSFAPPEAEGSACTATTADPAPSDWTSASSTSTTTWRWPGTGWRRTTTPNWTWERPTAPDAGTATMPARSMWTRFPGWPRYASASDESSREGPHSGPSPSYPGIRNAHPARSPTRSTDGGLRPKDLPAEIRSLSI